MSEVVPEAADKEKLEEIVAKDSKSGRSVSGPWYYLTAGMGIFMVLFYLYAAGIAPVDTQYFLGIYILITFVLVFLNYPMWHRSPQSRPTALDIILALIATFVVGYYILEYENLNYRMGSETALDTFVSIVGILISLEVARRVLGWSMTIVGLVFLLYAFWGDLLEYVPLLDVFAHTGFAIDRALNHIYLKQEGVFGIMATVLATYVIVFIFFGAFLKASGASRFFLDLPMALAGGSVGGPAKVAVIASGFFGSVSGSAIANTVSTGAFTIPLMKKAGFRPHVAGAIEPAASIGGMFMPPIMGAGGFIMAEMTEIPYISIMLIAIFPAAIYFLSVFTMIHFEAKRYGLRGIVDPDAPTAMQIIKTEWYMALPLVIIIVLMLMGKSPGLAAFWAIVSCVVVSWFSEDCKMGPKEILGAMIDGARNTLIIGATVGVIGIIVGTIALTGIGLKFSEIIISLSTIGGEPFLPLAILLIGLASLVLGMGVPVTAAYLITAVLAVGAVSDMISMQHFGMAFTDLEINRQYLEAASWVLISSHMIVYWFSQDSNITPPVCVAAYAGAAIAGSDPWKTGWTSFKFAKMLYIGPFLFAFSPAFLLGGPEHFMPWYSVLLAGITITMGTIAFGSLTMGYLLCGTNIVEWILFAVATTLLFFPTLLPLVLGLDTKVEMYKLLADAVGIGLWALVYALQKVRIKGDPSLTLPIDERKKLKEASA